jgi:ABC-type sugar transport system ATPase subunit
LTNTEIERLFATVRELSGQGVGIIYISHHLDEIFSIASRVTVMRDGNRVATRAITETSKVELIRLMVDRPIEAWNVRLQTKPGRPVLKVDGLRLERPDRKEPHILRNMSFEAFEGEILGLAGLLGAGRTELLESLFGIYGSLCHSALSICGRKTTIRSPAEAIGLGMALVTEDRKRNGLVMCMTIRDNMSLVSLASILKWGMLSPALQRRRTGEAIAKMLIRCRSDQQDAATLSGGNQQKVILGKWLSTKPRILLLDEPTRGIDIGAKWDIYRLLDQLAAAGCAIIMASSELLELLNICDRIMVLRQGEVAAVFSRGEATQEKILHAATPMTSRREAA